MNDELHLFTFNWNRINGIPPVLVKSNAFERVQTGWLDYVIPSCTYISPHRCGFSEQKEWIIKTLNIYLPTTIMLWYVPLSVAAPDNVA